MFARTFPATHPRKGEPTWFAEKIMAGLAEIIPNWTMYDDFVLYDWHQYYHAIEKYHTIRAGNRWKEGEYFSPRIWSGKPYRSKTIEFVRPIKIERTWIIKTCIKKSKPVCFINGKRIDFYTWSRLARNDGLTSANLTAWFRKPFTGQIICWNRNINY